MNSIDDLQQTSPTQIFSFPSTWPASPPPSQRTSDDDFANKVKEFKATPSFVKSTLECRHSRRVSNRSESIDLEMEDPLQSPTLTPAIAYLEERDLLPSTHSNTTITESQSLPSLFTPHDSLIFQIYRLTTTLTSYRISSALLWIRTPTSRPPRRRRISPASVRNVSSFLFIQPC